MDVLAVCRTVILLRGCTVLCRDGANNELCGHSQSAGSDGPCTPEIGEDNSEQRRLLLAHGAQHVAQLAQNRVELGALGGVCGPALGQQRPVAGRHVIRHRRFLPREHLEQHLRNAGKPPQQTTTGSHLLAAASCAFPSASLAHLSEGANLPSLKLPWQVLAKDIMQDIFPGYSRQFPPS